MTDRILGVQPSLTKPAARTARAYPAPSHRCWRVRCVSCLRT